MPPVRFAVLRVPFESSRPKRTSEPTVAGEGAPGTKVSETVSFSPTPSVTGEPAFVKNDQKASELLPTFVRSKVTEPAASVRTVVERPLKTRIELFAKS